MRDNTTEDHFAVPLMLCNCNACVDARLNGEIKQRVRDTRENPSGQVPRIATGEFRIPFARVPASDTPAWLDRLARAEALGRASGIAAERERCAKIALDSVNAEGYRTAYDSPITAQYFKGAVDIACQIAARIESGE